MAPSSEHPDRSAVRLTRRQALKAALAGVSLTLPIGIGLGRITPARAAPGPGACRKGCLHEAGRRHGEALGDCRANLAVSTIHFGLLAVFLAAPAATTLLGPAGLIASDVACVDLALLRHKSTAFDCYQPNCPNFDPYAKGNYCEFCPRGYCCPSQMADPGYCCATFPCGDRFACGDK
jgi:hypothetical protein